MNPLFKPLFFIFVCLCGISAEAQPLQFGGITEVSELKRGKEYSLRWSGGSDEMASIVLLNRSGREVQSWNELSNDGEHTIKIKSRAGKGHVLKIQSGGETVTSSAFRVKRRIPLALTISAIVAAPLAVYLLTPPTDSELEEVPTLPTNN